MFIIEWLDIGKHIEERANGYVDSAITIVIYLKISKIIKGRSKYKQSILTIVMGLYIMNAIIWSTI